MSTFSFHPELLEERQRVLEELGDADYAWPNDFGAVDLLHDVYGLEVCGIAAEPDARCILRLLKQLYPEWKYHYVYYKDRGAEAGWKVVIHRDPEDACDSWQSCDPDS